MSDNNERFRRNHFQRAVPSIAVGDCVQALGFYCDVLGFQKDFDDSILGVKRTLFAGVSRGECELTLNQHDRQTYRLTIGCRVDSVDLLYEEYCARGVKIILPPQDEVTGVRHMAIEDLYGHQLHFNSPIKPE